LAVEPALKQPNHLWGDVPFCPFGSHACDLSGRLPLAQALIPADAKITNRRLAVPLHGDYIVKNGNYIVKSGNYIVKHGNYIVKDGNYIVKDGNYIVKMCRISRTFGAENVGKSHFSPSPIKWDLDEYVLELDVTMYNSMVVEVGKALGDLP
jgi:hypothetical protein